MAPRRASPRSILAWSAIFAVSACNSIWGIDDGTLEQPSSSQAGQAAGDAGGAPLESAGAAPAQAGEPSESSGGVGGAAGGAAGETNAGGEVSSGGISGGGVGGTGGVAGSVSGSGGGGTGPTCSGCKLNDKDTGTQACGRCGTGSQTRTRTCDANCTWGAWSGWSVCSQCDTKNYRCCGDTGHWEWCYDSDCAWTKDCEACSASSCPECH